MVGNKMVQCSGTSRNMIIKRKLQDVQHEMCFERPWCLVWLTASTVTVTQTGLMSISRAGQ